MININTKIAELVGAMIGDGCLSLTYSKSENRIRRVALLTGHLKNDYNYYETVIQPILRKEFNVNGHLQKRPKYNCVCLKMSHGVFDFLKDLGLPIGKKIHLNIPPIILEDFELAKACVRGIFNTDGTIYRRYSKQYKGHSRVYDYLVIQIKMNSKEVICQIKEVLEKAGILSNRIIVDKKCFVLRITKQEEIKKFMEIIQPTNEYHVNRFITKCKK